MSTLGARFAQIQASKHSGDAKRTAVATQAGANQKGKRSNQLQAVRGLKPSPQKPVQPNKGGKPNSRPGSAGSKAKLVGKGGNANGKGNAKGKGKGQGKGKSDKPKREKPAPVDAATLDMDMDEYWHKAGKGPDPKLAALDREMDEYNKARQGTTAVASAYAVATEAAAV